MRRVSQGAKRALRALAWQAIGFIIVFVLLAIGVYRVETTRVLVEEDRNRSVGRICVDFHKVGYPCPKPSSRAAVRQTSGGGGDALQPASHAGQQPGPPEEGGRGGKQGGGRPKHHRHPKPSPAPPVAPAPAPSAPTQPQPGNSGSGASAAHGVDACVDLAVSACIKAELP